MHFISDEEGQNKVATRATAIKVYRTLLWW